MTTTRLLVELLVIGTWGSLWAYPVMALVVPRSLASYLGSQPELLLLVLLPFLYFWGMLVNFLSDQIFRFADKAIAREYGGKEHLQRLRACIIVRCKEGGEYLNQRRSMVRTYRANSVNCLCTLLVLALDVSDMRTLYDVGSLVGSFGAHPRHGCLRLGLRPYAARLFRVHPRCWRGHRWLSRRGSTPGSA